MPLYQLNKSVYLLSPHTEEFIQGLSSNTIHTPHNAFLDIHGKIVVTFGQILRDADHLLFAIEKSFEEKLQNHLKPFLDLSDTELTAEPWFTYFDLEGKSSLEDGDLSIPEKEGRMILSKNKKDAGISQDEFTLWRVKNNIPMQGIDYHHEMLLNVDDVTYVSFTKGCFLGQEIISRVHNKSRPPSKLVVKYLEECTPEEAVKLTSRVKDHDTSKEMGFVFMKNK